MMIVTLYLHYTESILYSRRIPVLASVSCPTEVLGHLLGGKTAWSE